MFAVGTLCTISPYLAHTLGVPSLHWTLLRPPPPPPLRPLCWHCCTLAPSKHHSAIMPAENLDHNKDGTVTIQEFEPEIYGMVPAEESFGTGKKLKRVTKMLHKAAKRAFKKVDIDGDAKMTPEE